MPRIDRSHSAQPRLAHGTKASSILQATESPRIRVGSKSAQRTYIFCFSMKLLPLRRRRYCAACEVADRHSRSRSCRMINDAGAASPCDPAEQARRPTLTIFVDRQLPPRATKSLPTHDNSTNKAFVKRPSLYLRLKSKEQLISLRQV